ncbi:AMP-binding protein, partial [Phenylobacterium sp.]|uniref:AMP-binding protein n=1 Tax=Phenylobacterium sp. TaxID=1871053 RepID=UPI00273330B8
TLGQLIIDAVVRFAERPAVSDGRISWTYAELGDQIGRYVTLYRQLGLGKGSGVMLLTSNRAEVWPSVCAANLMGIRYTPLHPMSAEADHVFTAEDCEAEALIVDAGPYGERAKAIQARCAGVKHLLAVGPLDGAIDVLALLPTLQSAPLIDEADPEDIAWLSYTGGTTGRSKGVMLPHRSIVAFAATVGGEWEWPKDLRYALVTPLSHSAGVKTYPVMMMGGYTRFIPGFHAEQFCQVVQDEKITATFLVPTVINSLLEAEEIRGRHDLSSLKMIIYGAAPMSPDRLQRAIHTFGPVFLQLYGQSECPECITTLRMVDHDLSKPERFSACGRPTALTTVKLLDAEGREVAEGEPGEICVRGPLVCNGYWKQPELTAQLFEGGWLHTGDVARRDAEGYLHIVDRTKDLIISGGFNIFPREVEDALMSHPAVLMAGVIGVPDDKWGEAVKALVTLRAGASAKEAELQAHVKAVRGAPWSPKSIDFVDEIPLTGLGKLDRKAMREPYWRGRARGVS